MVGISVMIESMTDVCKKLSDQRKKPSIDHLLMKAKKGGMRTVKYIHSHDKCTYPFMYHKNRWNSYFEHFYTPLL